jgi:hypothetical protein
MVAAALRPDNADGCGKGFAPPADRLASRNPFDLTAKELIDESATP